jgi:hypothetical protein
MNKISNYLLGAQKQPSLQDFQTKMITRVSLVPNLDHETRKTRIRTPHLKNNNPTRFYCKEKLKIKQGYNQKMYTKLVLNKFFKWGIILLYILTGHLT